MTDLVRTGRLDEALLDQAVRRILRAKFTLGLFENPYADPEYAEVIVNCQEHKDLALEAAKKAVILLKNDGDTLPFNLKSIRRLAVIGPNAAEIHLGGYSPRPNHGVSILEGIRARVGDQIEVLYAEGCRITKWVHEDWDTELDSRQAEPELCPTEENLPRIAEAVEIARQADAILLCVGGNESTCREAWGIKADRGDRSDLDLAGDQNELIRQIASVGKPTAAILINGRPLAATTLVECVPAILEGWYLGQETGHAVAAALFGDINPSGKLTITVPRSVGHLPCHYSQKHAGSFKKYLFVENSPLFPFGHGLSYTKFSYSAPRLEKECVPIGEPIEVEVDVTNIGGRSGDEIAQLYVTDLVASVTRPIMMLCDFRRVSLETNETKTVKFSVAPEQLAFTGVDMKRTIEPGEFEIHVGPNSVDLQTALLKVI